MARRSLNEPIRLVAVRMEADGSIINADPTQARALIDAGGAFIDDMEAALAAGYVPAEGEIDEDTSETDEVDALKAPAGLEPITLADGTEMSVEEIVENARKRSRKGPAKWNEQSDEDVGMRVAAYLETLTIAVDVEEEDDEDAEGDQDIE